ncbi:EamA family transporter [Halovibrio salipaludis]|uniref:EamA family transporter n=1 Tax=Halovibrio salipaludis TaxID=2032626 RepID=A0A2A2F511_9GAMM|nr:DMT family transporter [Halovibrio salipaludis]PAU80536.1 EamA family transporter [Halovibrio salipaludis]
MKEDRLGSVVVVLVGCLWGTYWFPLRQINEAAPLGSWSTACALFFAFVLLAPWVIVSLRRIRSVGLGTLMVTGAGGGAFVLYSNALLYGQVAVVILLFYLTPIWSTLIGRLWFGWPITPWRVAAIALGFLGIALVMGPSNGGVPLPSGIGDWMALISGLLWAISSTGIRTQPGLNAVECNFVFCLGGLATALLLAICLDGMIVPAVSTRDLAGVVVWSLFLGGLWWALALTAFLWSTQRMEPARVGILLMGEVVVGMVSAVLVAGEHLGGWMALGAVMVVTAAVIETWPREAKVHAAVEIRP